MKRLLAAAIAAAVMVVVIPTPAGAVTPAQRLARLEKRVTTLEKANKTLKKQLTEARDIASASLFFAVCDAAITADAFQSTWSTMNQAVGRTVVAPSAAVGDASVCSRLQVSRPASTPPTIGPFEQLMRLVTSSTATDAFSFLR